MNASWHRKHPMPKNPTVNQRIAWHVEHAKHCACRPIPPKLQQEINAQRRALRRKKIQRV